MAKEEIAELLEFKWGYNLLWIATDVLFMSATKLKRLFAKPWWEDVWEILGAEILRAGSGVENYMAAYYIPEADREKHRARAIELGYEC